ncbi:MAG TPA: hypothetical protein EYH24_07105 [Thermococcus paralvinellae]|uniref:Uncharacterized protein n=1 Tax=Thermococcus paralvinellae TaxID=582419 RepID=A0A833E4I8_9EURY|nr:hypothetical protein [Thermococcus paralvinellae]HIP89664.1 hypothetical protein [Thermococcus paralvinellae]
MVGSRIVLIYLIIYVGYPKNIGQQNGNFINIQIWFYYHFIKRLDEVLEEYRIQVKLVNEAVNEACTSITCPFHGKCGKRIPKSLFKCTNPKQGL